MGSPIRSSAARAANAVSSGWWEGAGGLLIGKLQTQKEASQISTGSFSSTELSYFVSGLLASCLLLIAFSLHISVIKLNRDHGVQGTAMIMSTYLQFLVSMGWGKNIFHEHWGHLYIYSNMVAQGAGDDQLIFLAGGLKASCVWDFLKSRS